ncbi:uncharacterized protein LOC114519468 [Dendronephthya gigantea]|uniref:uncharacterized protein LOC114519468 n=1 Tax=Dendronephthya gigantea TaxID=151771 RepID=UPI00106A8349|nr:uncharacterized protein LOC114519468 [Dendronephthya gigantea]
MADLKLVSCFCLLAFLQMKNHFTEGCGRPSSRQPGGKKTGAYPDCNFTNGFGGWADQDDGRWKIVNSTSSDAGILTGRQGVGDNFAMIASSSSWSRYAKLYSHDITGSVCMRFYFYLYGKETGYLKIKTRVKHSDYEITKFTRYGSHGHKWNLARIFLNFARTTIYQIIIFVNVGDSKSIIAIDDISFQNHTCDHLPKASVDFNCTFDSGICGWNVGYSDSRFDRDLNQYVLSLVQATLRSPRIFERDVCFTFQYHVYKFTSKKQPGIFVFIKDANNSQLLPMWSKRGYYDRGKWHTVKLRLRYENGFHQVEIRNVPSSLTYFANFYITSEIGDCNGIVDEKIFFVSIRKTSPVQHRISEDGVYCDNYPTSEFIARTIPSKDYPKPMYLFDDSQHVVFRQSDKRMGDDLVSYFYVSMARHQDSSAIYYKMQSDMYGQYISECRTTALDGNWTENVVYVKNHEIHKDNGDCPPGYLSLGKKDKCFWLMCDDSSNPESRCSEKLGTLASLDAVSTKRATEYLKYIKATSIGINQVTIGLSNDGHRWIWRDGRVYDDSDGLLFGRNISTKAFLYWKEENNSWVLKSGEPNGVRLHFCEEQGENIAYNSGSNQSSTALELSSHFAVDGLPCTYSSTKLLGKSSSNSWWKVELGDEKEIYLVQITWRVESKIDKATVSLERDDALPNFVKEVTSDEKSIITCGPPLPARYLKIEREKDAVEIFEVDVHATDSVLNDIRGVMQTAGASKQAILTTDHVFELASSFKAQTETYKMQKLEAYVLVPYDGVYNFAFRGHVDADLIISGHKDADDSLMEHSFNESSGQLSFTMRRSSIILLEACKFYYVKLLTSLTYFSNEITLNIEYKNSSNWMPIEATENLFWVLPGQLEVKLSVDNSTEESVFLSYPVNLTGRYRIKCLGLYCGDCPLVIFIYFSGHIECVVTSSRSIAQTDKISLRVAKKWFAFPGLQPIRMGYKTNEDCQSIKANTGSLNLSDALGLQEVGKINVKALTLIACGFTQSKFCQIRGKNSTVVINGWSPTEDVDQKGHKVNALTMRENMITHFSYVGVPYNWIVKRTGICSISEPNSTVAIANILITTEHCKDDSGVFPHFADPDSKCDSSKYFLCDNGECIGHSYVCDGDPRCADKSDEKDCECLASQFRCLGSGECVEKRFMCNGIANCGDGSDEKDCYKGCDPKQFYCPSGLCIPWNSTCNGVRDCPDGADEPNQTCNLNDLGCLDHVRSEELCAKTLANCDFERGLTSCQWHQVNDGSDDFDWSIGKGETSSKNTGPMTDHTTGSKEGSYIYIEASSPRVAGDKATLNAGPFKNVRKTTISKEQGNKTLNCSNLHAVIHILRVKLNPVNPDTLGSGLPKNACEKKPNVTIQLQSMCQFQTWCSLSAKSIRDNCFHERDNLTVLYKCVKKANGINPGQF